MAGVAARAARARADQELAKRIGTVHAESEATYGAPRVAAEYHADRVAVNHKRV